VYHDTFINNDDLTEATVQYGGELVEYKVYMPQTFRQIRTMHGIRKDDFCEEWSLEDNQEMSKGAGRSGSLFLRSRNSQYILKSLLKPEVKVVTTMLQPYSYYLQQNGSSLLSRMYAMFSVGKTVYLVQGNIANTQHIRGVKPRIYDLKGRVPKTGKFMREHDPDKVFKDNDTDHHFEMDSSKLQNLMQQVISDTTFLASRGVLDYSLLVAVASKPHGPPVYTDSRSSFHREFGGVVQEGPYPKVYFIGIIDMLTAWTPAKKIANFCKTTLWDESELSTVNPEYYATRFLDYMHQLWVPTGMQPNVPPFLLPSPKPTDFEKKPKQPKPPKDSYPGPYYGYAPPPMPPPMPYAPPPMAPPVVYSPPATPKKSKFGKKSKNPSPEFYPIPYTPMSAPVSPIVY
jgi:hypothetical protein